MITVIELLSYPLFHNFKLLSNDSGLYNNVLGTGIFEWETKEDINATFEVGEFVMTTLSSAKEDIRIAEEGFKALLQKKVSAIAVKSVYFSELPEELVRLSNLYRVPLFLFSDTYFDDIIYTIKSILISNDHNATLVKKVALLLESKEPETDLLTLSTEINPFFYDHFICAFCSPKVRNKECSLEEKTLYLDQFYESYLKMFKKNNPAHKSIYSLIKMNSGILLIFTYDNPDPSTLHKALLSELSYLGLDEEHFRIGISVPTHGLAGLANNIKKSIYACTSCIIENRTLLGYDGIGLNQFLFPLRHDPWLQDTYLKFRNILTDYDQKHNANLLQTLLEYIGNGGDILCTANRLFQHSNTIRYRLDKIKHILNIQDATDCYGQLCVFCKLHEAYQLLDHNPF